MAELVLKSRSELDAVMLELEVITYLRDLVYCKVQEMSRREDKYKRLSREAEAYLLERQLYVVMELNDILECDYTLPAEGL